MYKYVCPTWYRSKTQHFIIYTPFHKPALLAHVYKNMPTQCPKHSRTMAQGLYITAILVMCCLVPVAKGQSIGCFTPGECLQSLYIEINMTQTPEECLRHCKVRDQNYWINIVQCLCQSINLKGLCKETFCRMFPTVLPSHTWLTHKSALPGTIATHSALTPAQIVYLEMLPVTWL